MTRNNRLLPFLITIAFIISLSSYLTFVSAQPSNTSTPMVTNTATPNFMTESVTPTFAPTSTSQDLIDFQNVVKAFNVDLSCDIVCWNGFVPGKTSMKAVFSWLFQMEAHGTPQQEDSYVSYYKEPNAFLQSSRGNLSVAFMSDDTQPIPLLRAYYVGVGFPGDLTLWDKSAVRWLPAIVLQRFSNPKAITIGHPPNNDFDLILDYGEWGVEYVGAWEYTRTTPINGDVVGQRCPFTKTRTALLWVYSLNETSLFSLIKSIASKNLYVHGFTSFLSLQTVQAETYTTPASITAFLDALKTNGCF